MTNTCFCSRQKNLEITAVIWFKIEIKSEMIMCPVFREQQQKKIHQMEFHIKGQNR